MAYRIVETLTNIPYGFVRTFSEVRGYVVGASGNKADDDLKASSRKEDIKDEADLEPMEVAQEHERGLHMFRRSLQDPELSIKIGSFAGLLSVLNYGAAAREQGRAMREVVHLLYMEAVPHIYVCGGASMYRGVLSSVHRYSIRDNAWEVMPSLPTPRRLCAAAVCGNGLYVIGGEMEENAIFSASTHWRNYQQLATVERLSPFNGDWETLPDMPSPRAGCAAASIGSLLYVSGGRVHENVQRTSERFDIHVGRWERLPEVPTARSGCAAVSLFGLLYVIGGKGDDGQILTTMERFDPSIGWWQRMPSTSTPRSACAAGTAAGKIYVVGGFSGLEGVASVEAFDPMIGQWEEHQSMLTWRIGAASATADGKLFILGGKTEMETALQSEYMDVATGRWAWMPLMPERHVYCAGGAALGFC